MIDDKLYRRIDKIIIDLAHIVYSDPYLDKVHSIQINELIGCYIRKDCINNPENLDVKSLLFNLVTKENFRKQVIFNNSNIFYYLPYEGKLSIKIKGGELNKNLSIKTQEVQIV